MLRPSLTIEHADIVYGEQLGSGGFSVVYKGTWLGTLVAIKTWFDGSATAEQRCNIRQEVMTLAVRIRCASISTRCYVLL